MDYDIVSLLQELADRAAARAVAAGAEAAEVVVSDGLELSAKVRQGAPELVHEAGSRALGLRVFRDHRAALTYTSDLAPAAIDRFVAETVDLARLAEPDELNELPAEGSFAEVLPDLSLFDPGTLATTAAEAIEIARRAEAAAFAHSPLVTNSDGATYGRVIGASAFAIHGPRGRCFAGGYRGTYQSLTVEALADDTDGKKRNAYYWTGGHFLDQLEAPEAVGAEAARRCVAKLGARKIETGPLPVVFDPDAGRGLLRALASVLSGGAIFRRSSYLIGREGTAIASPLVHIVDDPLIPRGPGSRLYDGDGLPVRRNVIVDGGRLETYLLDTYSARKLGRTSNGCAGRGVGGAPYVTTSNLIFQPGTTPRAELLGEIRRGLYVTDLLGFGFNAVTGDFSRGAAGFLIEDGRLTQPVSEVTISANFDALWQGVVRVGDDLDRRTSIACPTFRVAEMMVAGR